MYNNVIFLFDFDSTFIQVESLDILADISLNEPNKQKKLDKIADLTKKGMNGSISFSDSLKERMHILSGSKEDLERLIEKLKTKISISIRQHKEFFKANKKNIYIVSSGFKDFIVPVVANYYIPANHVFANSFLWKNGYIKGFDTSNILSKNEGKPKLVKTLNFNKNVVVIGDGYTDYEIRKAGLAQRFIAYTENIFRPTVAQYADFTATNFNDFLNYISNEKALLSET